MSRYSDRARRNMRRQINGQIRAMRGILSSKERELKKIRSFRKYHLPGQSAMERAGMIGVGKAKRDLQTLIDRKARLAKLGRI